MGVSTPRSLFYAAFIKFNGEVLCLRGGHEHKGFKISQLKFGFEDDREFIEYTENGSKNCSGSYKDESGNKIVKHFGERCISVPDNILQYKTSFWFQVITELAYVRANALDTLSIVKVSPKCVDVRWGYDT